MKKVLLGCLLVLSLQVTAKDNQIKMTAAQFENLGIKTDRLKLIKQIPLLTAPAKVVIPPDQEHIISATQAGLISKLNVTQGDEVAQGQILARVKSPELLSLQRQYLKSRSEMKLALGKFKRDEKLLNEGLIPNRRWQETKSQYHAFFAMANELKQLLEISGMSKNEINKLASSQRLSSQLNIYSPINGVVLERMVVTGERLDVLAPLYRIANLDQLWLEINIPQQRMDNIKIGDPIRIENTDITAVVTLMGQSVNSKTQTVLVRAVINPPFLNLRAGQTVNAQIIQNADHPAYLVSNSAIANIGGQSFLFVRNPDGFTAIPVTIKGKQNIHSIVTSVEKLTESSDVAIRGAVALKAILQGLGDEE